MASINCPTCGAAISAGARFCRRCGQAVPASAQASVLEAETRTFAPPVEMGTPTQHINAPLTGPAYMAPGEMPAAPPAAVTKSLAPSGLRTSLMLVGFVLILLIAVAAVGVVKIFTSRASRPEPPTATVPEAPPPPPAPPPTGRDSSATTSPLVYPGAEIILDISKGENRVLQLRTTDPLDKVVAWYVEKLKPTSNTKVPGENLTVLQGNGVKAVITNTGAQTEIIIKQGADE